MLLSLSPPLIYFKNMYIIIIILFYMLSTLTGKKKWWYELRSTGNLDYGCSFTTTWVLPSRGPRPRSAGWPDSQAVDADDQKQNEMKSPYEIRTTNEDDLAWFNGMREGKALG